MPRNAEVPCPMPDCPEMLYLHWELGLPLFADDLTVPPVPGDAWAGDWKVECLAGHVVLVPADIRCPCGRDECTVECNDADVDADEELRTFRRSDADRLRALFGRLGVVAASHITEWRAVLDADPDDPAPTPAPSAGPDAQDVTVLDEIAAELARQGEVWGEQNHPDGTGPDVAFGFPGRMEEHARHARMRCQNKAAEGAVTWRHILTEEMFEALAEDDPAKLRTELIQVAAVAAQWVEAIDRRADRP